VNGLLALSRGIDWINLKIGRGVFWLVLATVLISCGNAVIRKLFDTSSNAWLEVQWYLFAAVFLGAAAYTLLVNEHVRIDFVSSKLSEKTKAWIDIIGLVVFLIPLCIFVIWLSFPYAIDAYKSGEMSSNAGGLIRWPVYLMLPVGFVLLLAQSVSELIKRFGFLAGAVPHLFPPKGQHAE
jgi:TRAP-type mannitol/chloroaromatic compound transport system permease small subunit